MCDCVSTKQFFDLPNELIHKILLYCSVRDLCRLLRTSRQLKEIVQSDYLWFKKWLELVEESGLSFATVTELFSECKYRNVSYYSCCKRLWCVCHEAEGKINNLPNCDHCLQKTCTNECLEKWDRKIAIDIGSKITWFITPSFFLQRHPSVIIISSLLKQYSNKVSSNHSSLCTYKSDALSFDKRREVCVIYNYSKYSNQYQTSHPVSNAVSCTSKVLTDESNSAELKEDPNKSNRSSSSLFDMPLFTFWTGLHEYFQNKFPNCEIVNPLDCLVRDAEFTILGHYVYHLFNRFQMLKTVQKPNITFMFCTPFNIKLDVQKKLLKFVFEVLQASRLCFINKALCISLLIGVNTCLVVDSGASNTVVSLIINGAVQFEKIQYCEVGGTSIANYLAHAIKIKGVMNNVNITSLDNSRVKSSCFLSYNIAAEERRKTTTKRNIFVRCSSSNTTELHKLELGSELYLAPEIMYAEMALPNMIKEAINGLDKGRAKEVLSHLLLTGNNTELNGFTTRLVRDLQALLPQYAHVINVQTYPGSRSSEAIIGATHFSTFSDLKSSGKFPSSLCLVTREEYILYGCDVINHSE